MKKLVILPVLLFITAIQPPPPLVVGDKLGWDQAAPTLVEAQAATYKYYLDSSATGIAFVNVTCSGTVSPFPCQVVTPIFSPGNHTIQLTASNAAGESLKSSPFAFSFVVTLNSPSGIRIIK